MCVKCKHRVFFDPITKVLYYMDDGCNKVPLPADALVGTDSGSGGVPIGGGDSPSLPPDDQLPTDLTALTACRKAVGVWQVIEDFTNALVLSVTGTDILVWGAYSSFQTQYGLGLKAKNYNLLDFMSDHYTDDPDIGIDWTAHKDAVKADFICAAQDAFEKFGLLTDRDMAWLLAYDFDSPSAVLDDFMTDMLSVPENSAWREAASYHVFSEIGECDCVGGSIPPDVPEGYGRVEVHFGNTWTLTDFPDIASDPQAFMAGSLELGRLVSADSIESTGQPVLGGNQAIGALYVAPEGALIKSVKYSFFWAGGADPSKEVDIGGARANAVDGAFASVFESHQESAGYVPQQDDLELSIAGDESPYFLHNYLAYGTDAAFNGEMLLSNIRFDLVALDGSWSRTDVPLGTVFPLF